jgi:hypothetical protein
MEKRNMKMQPDEILIAMADTYRERSKQYGNNWRKIGAVMVALYPTGLTLETEDDFNKFHLFLLSMVKLTRLSESGLSHQDSAHDNAVYSAMLESLIIEGDNDDIHSV